MRSATRRATIWLPLALCILLTVAASAFVGRAEHAAQAARFANEMSLVEAHIEERMATYMGVMRGAAGLVSGKIGAARLTASELAAFVDRLDLRRSYPGTLGIGYSERFGSIPVAVATERARAQGWHVRVWPDTPRDEVHAIVAIEPLDARNQRAIGYDMGTEPTRRAAMERARDEGDVALSGKVRLVQEIENEKQAGFLLYAPVYHDGVVPTTLAERRAKLEGYVYMPLRAGDLFTGIFGNARPGIAYELYDGTTSAPERSLYTYGSRIADGECGTCVTMTIAGRPWTLRFVPAPGTPTGSLLTLEVAAFGLLLSVIVLFVTRARERAREREVRATAAALASEETARLRELFVGILGHDLMNPLHSIVLSTELLQRDLANNDKAARVLARLRSSTQRMVRMIDQTLDLTRARLGRGFSITARQTDLGMVVHEVVDEIARTNPDGPVDVEAKGDLEGEWDPDRLAQVMSNLVGNAVRYHREQPVRVTIDGTAHERVRVEVHNAGVISPALLPVVFDPFRGSDVRTKAKTPGLGLGLFIAHEIVRAHRGTLDVVSSEEGGTTFTVVLPRGTAAAAPMLASQRLTPV